MTILPTKRHASVEETNVNAQSNVSTERNRRDERRTDSNASTKRSSFIFTNNTSERKVRHHKRFKENEPVRDTDVRRDEKRKRETPENNDNSPQTNTVNPEPTQNNSAVVTKEDGTGFNSEDEYENKCIRQHSKLTNEEWQKRDHYFVKCMSTLGYQIKQMNEDGACLFRSIADQVYGDQECHPKVREDCMNYIIKNRAYFEPYVTEDFDKYVSRKKQWSVHGNHLEIQAMSEMYNRTIEVYCYQREPIYIFNSPFSKYEPIRLSYHRMCHYNSISNPNKPALGVPSFVPHFNSSPRSSEQLLIEQTMLEDKILATDWEATNEAIEEQVARESYIQYLRDNERRLNIQSNNVQTSSSSTITSRRGSASPKGNQSPHATPRNTSESSMQHSPSPFVPAESNNGIEVNREKYCDIQQAGPSTDVNRDFDQELMARVMAESQQTYLDELKLRSKKNCASSETATSN